MGEVVYVALLGLGLGALYAMLGQSIVVARLGSGLVNLAAGAMAVSATYQFVELRREGDLVLPLLDVLPGALDVPVRLSLSDGGLAFWPAFAGALAMAALVGLVVHLVVAWPLRRAAPAAQAAAMVGVLLYLQGTVALADRLGERGRVLEAVLPHRLLSNVAGSGRSLPTDALYAAGVAVLLAVVLWVVMRRTRVGLALRAVAGDHQGAALLGISARRVSAYSWVLAGVLGATAGIVVGPLAGRLLGGDAMSWVVPALAAALIGGLRSVGWATVGGLLVGVGQGLVAHVATADDRDWFPDVVRFGLPDAVPLVVIVVVLICRPSLLPSRAAAGVVRRPPLPKVPHPERVVVWAVVGPVAALLACLALSGTWEAALVTSIISAVLLLSYVVLTGYVGEAPLAQLALAGVTGFVLVRLMSDGAPDPAGRFPFPGWLMAFALPVAVAAAVVVGLLIALPAVRGRGVELSVVTLAAAVALERWYFDSPALTGVGARTTAPLPASSPGGLELANTGGDRFAFSALAIAALLVCALAVVNLRRGETGRRFLAVRANAGAAAASGIDVARTRLVAVGVASALAGVAGGLFALQRGEVGASDWTLVGGLVLLAFAAIGGITSVSGALLGGLLTAGGLVMAFATLHIDTLGQHITALPGLGLVAITVLRPTGLATLLQPSCSHMATCLVTWRGPEWIRAALRYGPWLVVGAGAGWLLWTRHEGFSWWMLLLGALLGLAVRQLLEVAVRRRRRRPRPAKVAARTVRAAWPPPVPASTNGSTNGSNGASHAGNGAVPHAVNGAHAVLSVPRPRAYLPRPAHPQPLPAGRALLRVTELTVAFGGVQALTDLDLTVDEGTVAGLVGPNGAGKTAFVDAVTGALRPQAGGIELDGRAIGRLSTAARARRGLVRTFADGELFDDLTVRDNLMVAAQQPRWWSVLADMVRPGRRSRAVEDQADWAIGALGLERLADEVAADLTHSKRKLVAIARALAARPKLLVLDEPASGLDHADRQLLRARLRDLPARGTTVLLVDHDLGLALDVCDTVHVLDLGAVIASGPPATVSTNDAVLLAYLGSNGHQAPLAPPSPTAKVPQLPTVAGRTP